MTWFDHRYITNNFELIMTICIYCILLKITMMYFKGKVKALALAAINMGFVIFYYYPGGAYLFNKSFLVVGLFICAYYFLLVMSKKTNNNLLWVFSIWLPILGLLGFKLLAVNIIYAVGISYIAFRLINFAIEVKTNRVELPSFAHYIAFTYYLPTLYLGPISPYTKYEHSVILNKKVDYKLIDSLYRILIGIIKCMLLSIYFNQFSFTSYFLEIPSPDWFDFLISCLGYYAYLYCNFSGLCDISLGVSWFVGIDIAENFKNPFVARNIMDFWRRWHITLGAFMNEVVFATLNKTLSQFVSLKYLQYLIIVNIFIVFILIGLWHGLERNYIYFGLMHAVGASIVHLYTIFMKKKLKEKFINFVNGSTVKILAIACTFLYVCGSFFLFECSHEKIVIILHKLFYG